MARLQHEKTGKAFKIMMTAGVLIAIYGAIKTADGNVESGFDGLLVVFLGFMLFGLGKFLAWWKHG